MIGRIVIIVQLFVVIALLAEIASKAGGGPSRIDPVVRQFFPGR